MNGASGREPASPAPAVENREFPTAFTLLELLVVISILGILAALSVPALKNLGQSNSQTSAVQQVLDGVSRARQLAISQHTTVYMVFVTTNFFNLNNDKGQSLVTGLETLANFSGSSAEQQAAQQTALTTLTNLLADQLTGYNFISHGHVGDQPGQHQWHYLDDWQTLPDGSFIAAPKFLYQNYSLIIPRWQADQAGQIDSGWTIPSSSLIPPNAKANQISGFARSSQAIPFPTEKSPGVYYLPYIAFDYRGQLISEVDTYGNYHHAYIPLAQGSVGYSLNPATKMPVIPTSPVTASDIQEKPPGNSTNISYNVIDINPLTGRASLQKYQMQ